MYVEVPQQNISYSEFFPGLLGFLNLMFFVVSSAFFSIFFSPSPLFLRFFFFFDSFSC